MSNVKTNIYPVTTAPGQFARYAEGNIWQGSGGANVARMGSQPRQGYSGRCTPKSIRHDKPTAHKASLGYATATALAYIFKAFIYIIILLVIRFVLHL